MGLERATRTIYPRCMLTVDVPFICALLGPRHTLEKCKYDVFRLLFPNKYLDLGKKRLEIQRKKRFCNQRSSRKFYAYQHRRFGQRECIMRLGESRSTGYACQLICAAEPPGTM